MQEFSSSTGLEYFKYPPDSTGELQDLTAKVSVKWKEIARYLNVPENTIESIGRQYRVNRMDDCLMRVFDWWQMNHTTQYTWATIIEILKKPTVGPDQLRLA